MERPWTLEGQRGPIGSPVGVLGVNLDYVLDPNVSLTGGIGMSWLPRPQFSLMGRPRIFVGDAAIFVGLGVSVGPYIPLFQGFWKGGSYTERGVNPAVWFNQEVGLENRKGRFSFRSAVGLAQLVHVFPTECRSIRQGKPASDWETCGSLDDGWLSTRLPYLRFTVGYTL
jgi:hypothetical protein